MAGLVGSLAMLLEPNRLGVAVDLDRLPVPAGVTLAAWLGCFPAYAFLLTCEPATVTALRAGFHGRGLQAAHVGELDGTRPGPAARGRRRRDCVRPDRGRRHPSAPLSADRRGISCRSRGALARTSSVIMHKSAQVTLRGWRLSAGRCSSAGAGRRGSPRVGRRATSPATGRTAVLGTWTCAIIRVPPSCAGGGHREPHERAADPGAAVCRQHREPVAFPLPGTRRLESDRAGSRSGYSRTVPAATPSTKPSTWTVAGSSSCSSTSDPGRCAARGRRSPCRMR